MNPAFAYPNSEYAIPQPVDLSRKEERERLSQAALKGFFKLAAAWKLRDDDARELLGGLSSSAFYEWKKQYVLKKHWLAHTKRTCPRCHIPFVKAHLGRTNRRSFFCERCQVRYG